MILKLSTICIHLLSRYTGTTSSSIENPEQVTIGEHSDHNSWHNGVWNFKHDLSTTVIMHNINCRIKILNLKFKKTEKTLIVKKIDT